jgi:serine/threonine-protein kinase PRP4
VPRKPNISPYTMTNVSSGIKRTWDSVEIESNKRPRSREEPKDWKDVYLKSPSSKAPVERRHTRDYDADRRICIQRRGDRRDRDPEYRRPADHGRVRDRSSRDDRERERERYKARKDEIPHRNGFLRSKAKSITPEPVERQAREDSEREEGE